jgi:[ribosomal protein S5]-alanine N-acetyltransferase
MIDIETDRLVLRLVPLAALASTAAEMVDITKSLIGENLPLEWFAESWVYKTRYDQWVADPSFAPWSVRAIALKDTGQIVGNMNCHHRPMPFVLNGKTCNAVEMGYTIFAPWQRQGIAFEAVNGFVAWAKTEGLEGIILSIQPGNAASLGLAAKFGATHIGSQTDPNHGAEDIYFFPL